MQIKKKNNHKNNYFLLLIFIIILLIFYKIKLILFINNLFSFMQLKNEFIKIKNYLKLSHINILKINIIKYKKIMNPKISVISPVFNNQKYILRFLKNINNQNYKDIEIILIDDCSLDNSVKIIEEYKKQNEKVILIKNKKNKGTFISRNLGVLFSKGKYLILPDPDDILSKNILKICYKFAEKYNYEMIRFNLYLTNKNLILNENTNNLEDKPIYQPYLSSYIFYGNNELQIIDYYITNKFIKKKVYIRALNKINNYLNMLMIFMEDSIMNFALYMGAESFYFLKVIGYYYIKNNQSITNNLFKISILRTKYIFIELKFIFEFSKNTKFEKDKANYMFIILNKLYNIKYYLNKISNFDNDLYFFFDIINLYIKSKFISKENKFILKELKNIIEKKSQIIQNKKNN